MNKRIVVISEASLDNNVTGMAQTLANLFDNYPTDNLLFCSPKSSSGKFKRINSIPYKSFVFTNRVLKKLVPLNLRNRFFEKIKMPAVVKKILKFRPDLVIVS